MYKKRKAGKPIVLNNLWRSNIENSTEFRITLQYLSNDKEYIWVERHRDIGNVFDGKEQTLDNVIVRGKITEKGIDFYRSEYRDEPLKYLALRLGVLAIMCPAIWWVIKKINEFCNQ